jgi:hypothetical protein
VVLLAGFPYFVAIINLPQRFQIVNGDTPILAGVHLLPMLCLVAFGSSQFLLHETARLTFYLGSAIGGVMSSKSNLTAYTAIVVSRLILSACGLFTIASGSSPIDRAIYVYEVILEFRNGLTFSSIAMMVNLVSKSEDNGKFLYSPLKE